MTSTSRRPPADARPADERSGADPWWGFDDVPPIASADELVAVRRASVDSATRRRGGRRSSMTRIGWLVLGLLVTPLGLIGRLLASNARLRRWALRVVVVLGVLAVLASSVGVILINNVVIGRSAELGELDDTRRQLRRENALLSARAARLSSPDVVFRRATRELGMVPTDDVPQFIYLVPDSRTLTPLQRSRTVARAQRQSTRAAAPVSTTRESSAGAG